MRGAIESGRTRVTTIVAMVMSINGHAHSCHFSASSFAASAKAMTPAAAPLS